MDNQKIESRVAGRALARDLFDLAELGASSEELADACLKELVALARQAGVLPTPPPPQAPRAPIPIARLGQTVMPFGAHKGTKLDECELEYLDWLCRSQEGFLARLRAYLKHPQLADHRGEGR